MTWRNKIDTEMREKLSAICKTKKHIRISFFFLCEKCLFTYWNNHHVSISQYFYKTNIERTRNFICWMQTNRLFVSFHFSFKIIVIIMAILHVNAKRRNHTGSIYMDFFRNFLNDILTSIIILTNSICCCYYTN